VRYLAMDEHGQVVDKVNTVYLHVHAWNSPRAVMLSQFTAKT
jgi:hypothetical protein